MFSADYSEQSGQMTRLFEDLADDYADYIEFVNVNITENREIQEAEHITYLPMFKIFNG